MTPYAACGTLLLALLGLAGCGGSGSGGSSGMTLVDLPPLANVTPGTPPPCLAAFAPVDPADSGARALNAATAMATIGAANKMASNDTPRATETVSRMLAASGMPSDSKPLTALVIPLSSCESKLSRNRDVVIGPGPDECGPLVVIDQSFKGAKALGKITIKAGGGLSVPDLIPNDLLEIETAGITVAGTLSIGTSACPVGGKGNPDGRVKVTFTGVQADANPDPEQFAGKGIEVQEGGILRLYGAKGVESREGVNWTHLSRPSGPVKYQNANVGIKAPVASGGERRLSLARDVSKGHGNGWQAGDWIVVATSSFSPFESEFAQIESVSADGRELTLKKEHALRHYHFGGADPGLPTDAGNYGAGKATNYGVDERSEVGLISRNISFTARTTTTTSTDPKNPDQNHHWGGEIRIGQGFAEAIVQGVELEKFGKARLGSYPVHFHMVGDADRPNPKTGQTAPHLVDSNSIHHSYNKCVTVHMSRGIHISNNVCARAVGHLFYQEMAEEERGSFTGNLGLGAMSHWFGIDKNAVTKTDDGLVKNWWEGDNLARVNGYDGLNVPNKDRQTNAMSGGCYIADPQNSALRIYGGSQNKPCADPTLYIEQASGFWIGNPSTVLTGNSIGGCQGTGKAYWYVPPRAGTQKNEPVGAFINNRAHACFDGLFGETEGTESDQLFPREPKDASGAQARLAGNKMSDPDGDNLIARFENFTATRNRNRGVWLRPMWTVVEHSRFATNRDSVSLVSSGGADGNAPGVWAMLKDSVLVGLSENNVDRWGPCPSNTGDGRGCVDANPLANEVIDKGYQSPRWNSAGYMIYDGPVRIIDNHFVNFLKDITSLLTVEDQKALEAFSYGSNKTFPQMPPTKVYEGDAALGWFQNNQSAYPTSSVTKGLSFDNVDLRHQIYTEGVNLGDFKDGDKNTAVIDLDGSLTGFQIVDGNGHKVPGEYPISLNNLPFNRTGNAVDECLSEGQQDTEFEGRATSLISPANMATLEFEAFYPYTHPFVQSKTDPKIVPARMWQDMVFMKDSKEAAGDTEHQKMVLQSRNGQGIWEPKVASGTGYTVRTQPTTTTEPPFKPGTGMPGTLYVGLTDAVKSDMGNKPFHVRVGICYSNANGGSPNGNFKITRGYKSWGGNGVTYDNADVRANFNKLDGLYDGQTCYNSNTQGLAGVSNTDPVKGCPADGVVLKKAGQSCPAGSVPGLVNDRTGQAVCIYKKSEPLRSASSITDLTNLDGTPTADGFDKYYFDATTGMLFFYVMQNSPNAQGVAPVGSCAKKNDPACPQHGEELETYFACPPQGCVNYAVVLDDPLYTPGASTCDARANGSVYNHQNGAFTSPTPVITNKLGYLDGSTVVATRNPSRGSLNPSPIPFMRWTAKEPESCKLTTPIKRSGVPVASAGAAASATPWSAGRVAAWLRERITVGSAATLDWSRNLFAAQPVPQIDAMAQICKANPG